MEQIKKSFGEMWKELTDEQQEYFKGYIDRQRKDAVDEYKSKQCNMGGLSKVMDTKLEELKNFDVEKPYSWEGILKTGAIDGKIELAEEIKSLSNQYIELERAKKYARHQHFLGTQGKDLVEFEDWACE